MIKKFVIKSLVFIIPVILFILFGLYQLRLFGENIPIDDVIEQQLNSKDELLFRRKFLQNPTSVYKEKMLLKKQPTVLVVGQSVVNQFRDYMFHPYENDFYNSAKWIKSIDELNKIEILIENKKLKIPKTILIGLDYTYFFTENTDKNRIDNIFNSKDKVKELDVNISGIQKLYKSFNNLPDYLINGIGIDGKQEFAVRRDGSMNYKYRINKIIKNNFIKNYSQLNINIKRKKYPFNNGWVFDKLKAEKSLSILKTLKNKYNIEVIVYFPTMSNYLMKKMIKIKEFSFFWKDYLTLQLKFSLNNFKIIEFKLPNENGFTDDFMIDHIHPTEKLTLEIWNTFLENNITLYSISDYELISNSLFPYQK